MKEEPIQGRPNLVEEFRKTFIPENLPEFLYHYTSLEAFKGIIENEEMWATATNHLVDRKEITVAKSIAPEVLEEREKDFIGKEELYNECKMFIESYDMNKGYQFICSFTEEEDLLSQWEEYCRQGGVSIRFSLPRIGENDQYLNIKNGSSHNNYYAHETYLYKCIYNPQEQKRKINELLDFILEHTESVRELPGFLIRACFKKMFQTFSCSFKDESFEEEREWRLYSWAWPDDGQIEYKEPERIPYVPWRMIDEEGHTIISRIMVGPFGDREELESSILSHLNNPGVRLSPKQIEITQTKHRP